MGGRLVQLSFLRKIRNQSLRAKLLMGALIIAASLMVFAGYLLVQLSDIRHSNTQLATRYDQLKDLLRLEQDTIKINNAVSAYTLTAQDKYQSDYNSLSADLDNTLTDVKGNTLDPQSNQDINQYQDILSKIKGTELLILADTKAGDLTQARMLFNLSYEQKQSQATDLIASIVSRESSVVTTTANKSTESITRAQVSLTVTLVSLLVVLLAIASLFAADVLSSIEALSRAAKAFAKGDFSVRVPLAAKDEIGELSQEFNAMANQLKMSYDRLTHERARFISSIDSLPLGFIITGPSGEILNMNRTMRHLLGLSDKITIDKVSERLQGRVLSTLLEASEKCLQSKQGTTLSDINDNGRVYRAIISPVLLFDNENRAIGTVIVVEDVTEQNILNRSKDEFFSIASHELRTPLAAIRGNASMIEQFFDSAMKDPQLRDIISDIHSSSVRLIDIVNDFLDVSRLEQGKVTFKNEAFNIDEILESVVYETAPIIREKHLEIKIDKTLNNVPQVYADKNRVKQIVYNLVGNALKFTESGSISIERRQDDNMLKVLVTDTGPGISEDGQQLLFHKFQQAGDSLYTRDTSRGTGLGLYISKLLVEKMGGKITLESSALGRGTTFAFTLPLATPENMTATPTPAATENSDSTTDKS